MHIQPLIARLRAFFLPPPLAIAMLRVPAGVAPSLLLAYEKSLTTLFRLGGGLGLAALLAVSPILFMQGRLLQILFVASIMGILLLCGIVRQLSYWLRCGVCMACFYCLAIADLLYLGLSAEVYIYLIGFALFATIYFSYRLYIGLFALALSIATLACFGMLAQVGAFRPLLSLQPDDMAELLVIRALLFLLVVGTGQTGILALLNALKAAWHGEQAAREQLESRVAERTRELSVAHTQALAYGQQQVRQQEYLAALHQTTLELLNQRDVVALLHAIVERACSILDSTYALIVLEQDGDLVVMARTNGVLAPIGERALRDRAIMTWQCYETQRPVIVDNYQAHERRNRKMDLLKLTAVVSLPILDGQRCLGVLTCNRVAPDQPYSAVDVEQGLAFARLAAVVIDNARLHEAAQRELAERQRAEVTLQRQADALAAAHAQALAQSAREAQQSAYLSALHQLTLDLLGQRDIDALLQAVVDRAAPLLGADHSLVRLEQAGELVLRAFTRGSNLALTPGAQAPRDVASSMWQAYETRQPSVIHNYIAQPNRNPAYDALELREVASIPILAGDKCLGVLGLGRAQPGAAFTAEELEQGMIFARLIALVLDNQRLYDAAQNELAERQRAEQSLKRYADALERQNTELDAFAHTVAHDLKSPLTNIIGYTELLINNASLFSERETAKFLGTIMQMSQKMTRIINDLLLLASVHAEEAVPMKPLDFDELMLDIDIRLAQAVASSQATIERPARWPAALGYAPWVEEVLANYLSNAIKYGGQPPHVRLGAEPTGNGQVRFWVEDNGPGLSADEQALLFTPFTRLRRQRAEGHGLGLSIVQRIIHALGGTVGVESQPGQGSRFFFTLPAAPIESADAPAQPPYT